VLQSGGDEGMWTFDRYHRWMEQVSDWVRPTQGAPRSAEGSLPGRTAGLRQGTTVPPPASMPPRPAAKPAQTKPVRAPSAPADDVFEVPAEDMDLAQLAELAKKVVERKP
jgi:hypothetical protein